MAWRNTVVSGFLAVWLLAVSAASAVQADVSRVVPLLEAMRITDVLDVMAAEGADYGDDIEEQMFPYRGRAAWAAEVARIYDLSALRGKMATRFEAAASDDMIVEMSTFFTSDLGARIVELEISARRAMMSDGVKEDAIAAYQALAVSDPGRIALIESFVAANDLIESNVMGGMNANLAFYKGMAASGAFEGSFSEPDMVTEVWSQEAALRADTVEWVYGFLAMAYAPLSDAELQAYVDISESSVGQEFNRVVFNGFDRMFAEISFQLGQAVAKYMVSEEL